MQIGIILIGSQLTTGNRQDRHMAHAIEVFARRGIDLAYCQILASDPGLITRSLRHTMSDQDHAFVFGGLGCTPDDHTRQCAAEASGAILETNQDVAREIEHNLGDESYPHCITLANLPQGAGLIPNPINPFPGFSIRNHHFLPGFTRMAWPMMDWVLDTHYTHAGSHAPPVEFFIHTHDVMERELVDLMSDFMQRFPDVGFASLPHLLNGNTTDVEFGVRGHEGLVRDGMQWLTAELNARGYHWEATRGRRF